MIKPKCSHSIPAICTKRTEKKSNGEQSISDKWRVDLTAVTQPFRCPNVF